MINKVLFSLSLAFISSSLLATPILSVFNESLSERVKVSGRFHAGLQINTTIPSDKLYVLMPENSDKKLCVDIASVDGIYRANIIYQLNSEQKGYIELPFDSKYKSQLLQYRPLELAVKATIGTSCESMGNRNILTSWGKDSDATSLVLLIRSDARSDVAYIPDIKNPSHKVKCQKIETRYNVAYDKYCLFEGLELQSVNSIEVERKNLRLIPHETFEVN